ncbi:hypothetical protein ACHAWF_005800 [Thalassiosira exigua]
MDGFLGVNPAHFSAGLFGLLFLFVLYLLLPRGVRVQYFGSHPKRYAWSARSRSGRRGKGGRGGGSGGDGSHSGVGGGAGGGGGGGSSVGSGARGGGGAAGPYGPPGHGPGYGDGKASASQGGISGGASGEDIVVSAAMQQLRDPGVLIVAHGSRGKPKTVRLVLTEQAITWRTEMRKKSAHGGGKELKLGKLHQVPLSHIMYVDIGKQTTALRRVENASVSEALCFSLLTKEGSLDLEANSPRERDALVQCFSLVLDEVHAQNWRDIYRGPSSDMPSSFDEGDGQGNAGGGGGSGRGGGGMP